MTRETRRAVERDHATRAELTQDDEHVRQREPGDLEQRTDRGATVDEREEACLLLVHDRLEAGDVRDVAVPEVDEQPCRRVVGGAGYYIG